MCEAGGSRVLAEGIREGGEVTWRMWEMVRVFLAGAKAAVRAHFRASSLQGGGLEDGQGLGPGRQL